MNLIEAAVLPLKADAIAKAEQWANGRIEHMRVELEKAGNDLNVCAPYPKTYDVRREVALTKYRLFSALVKFRKGSHMHGTPLLADMAPDRCEKFVKNAKDDAAAQYDMFVLKLVAKIGDVTSASLSGNHVWSWSILTVTKPDGAVEYWKTQQIMNVSKLGKLFNQWPTRKQKG